MIPAAEWDVARRARTDADVARIAAWLRLPADAPGLAFAVEPFAVLNTDDGATLAAAIDPPVTFPAWEQFSLDHDGHHFEWEDAIEAHRVRLGSCGADSPILLADKGILHRDRASALIAPPADDALTLYTSARAFVRDWARRRLEFIARRAVAARDYFVDMREPGDNCLPGALLIGDAARVQWPQGITFACPDDATAKAVTRAIHRRANLARAVVASPMRIAA